MTNHPKKPSLKAKVDPRRAAFKRRYKAARLRQNRHLLKTLREAFETHEHMDGLVDDALSPALLPTMDEHSYEREIAEQAIGYAYDCGWVQAARECIAGASELLIVLGVANANSLPPHWLADDTADFFNDATKGDALRRMDAKAAFVRLGEWAIADRNALRDQIESHKMGYAAPRPLTPRPRLPDSGTLTIDLGSLTHGQRAAMVTFLHDNGIVAKIDRTLPPEIKPAPGCTAEETADEQYRTVTIKRLEPDPADFEAMVSVREIALRLAQDLVLRAPEHPISQGGVTAIAIQYEAFLLSQRGWPRGSGQPAGAGTK